MGIVDKLTILKHKMNVNDVFMEYEHDINPVQEWNNSEHIIMSFPSLFPYGLGGFFLEKRKKLTFREHLNYLLNIRCDRFRNHKHFMFVCFNILQRKEGYNNIRLTVKQPHFKETIEVIRIIS